MKALQLVMKVLGIIIIVIGGIGVLISILELSNTVITYAKVPLEGAVIWITIGALIIFGSTKIKSSADIDADEW